MTIFSWDLMASLMRWAALVMPGRSCGAWRWWRLGERKFWQRGRSARPGLRRIWAMRGEVVGGAGEGLGGGGGGEAGGGEVWGGGEVGGAGVGGDGGGGGGGFEGGGEVGGLGGGGCDGPSLGLLHPCVLMEIVKRVGILAG